MDILVAYLIHSLHTIDGQRGTANFIIEAAVRSEVARREREINRGVMRKR